MKVRGAFRLPMRPFCFSLIFATLSVWCFALPPTKNTVVWTMLNVEGEVGQADCHLLQFPDNINVLIDVADGVDAPNAALINLMRLNVSRLSLVVISHFHRDHYGRLIDLLNAGITVDHVVLNVPDKGAADREIPWGCDFNEVQSVLSELRHRGIPFSTPRAGDRLLEVKTGTGATAGIDVLCCYDGLNTPVGPTDVNDTSILLRVFDGPTRALFTGDLNHALGAYLAQSNIDLRADLLKAPHHGAESTAPNEFYDRVAPKAVLVPSPKVLWESALSMRTRDYFIEHHTPVYVGGINGNVTVTLSESGYSIEKER